MMKKLLAIVFLLALALPVFAQVPARSVPATCVRDDTLSALTPAEGQQVPCRVDSIGNIWVNLGTTLDKTNDSITIWGSDDAGTTKRVIKTDSGGAVQVDIESGVDGIIKDGTGDTTQANVSSGRLHVDGSGVTQPVSGTVTANAGSGTFFDGIIRDGTGDTTQANVTSGNLNVTCANCSGSGAVHTDDAAFTGASDDVAPAGFLYDTTPPTITDGNLGAARMNSSRQIYVDLATRLDQTNDAVTVYGSDDGGTTKRLIKTDSGGAVQVDIESAPSLTIGTFPDNEPFNVSQINGVTPLMGNGATGTGSPRVTVSNDSSAIAGWGHGATGSASPSGATQTGWRASGNLVTPILCDNRAIYNAATSGSTELVALTSSQVIYICSWKAQTTSATGVDVKLVYGTGTNCGTGSTDITMPWNLDTDISPGFVDNTESGNARKTAASNALCINASGATTVRAEVLYTKF